MRNTTTLDMQEVDIIVYDFTPTKAGRLRKSTIDIIKEKLLSLQGFTIKGGPDRLHMIWDHNIES